MERQSGPTERQVLYALVAAGFHAVTGVLITAGAVLGFSPPWFSFSSGVLWVVAAGWGGARWTQTARVLALSIGLLVAWVVGALVFR